MSSNVGNSSLYEDGDQKNVPKSELEQEKKDARFHEGKENSHLALDSSKIHHIIRSLGTLLLTTQTEDERSIANKLAREEKVGHSST